MIENLSDFQIHTQHTQVSFPIIPVIPRCVGGAGGRPSYVYN